MMNTEINKSGNLRMTKDSVQRIIRRRIVARHGSVNQFCKIHAFDQSTLNKFLTGQRDMKLFKFFELCDALSLDLTGVPMNQKPLS